MSRGEGDPAAAREDGRGDALLELIRELTDADAVVGVEGEAPQVARRCVEGRTEALDGAAPGLPLGELDPERLPADWRAWVSAEGQAQEARAAVAAEVPDGAGRPGTLVCLFTAVDQRRTKVLSRVATLRRALAEAPALRSPAEPAVPSAAAVCSFLDRLPDAITVMDRSGVHLRLNDAWFRVFGWTSEELLGRPYQEIVHPDDIELIRSVSRDLVRGGVAVEVEHRLLHRDGSYRRVSATAVGDPQEGAFFVLFRDITEIKRLHTLKQEFISTVSHELRTPLTSLRGSIGLLSSGALGPVSPSMREMLDIASRNASRLVRLVNDILDLEGLGSGRMSLAREDVDLIDVLSESVEASGAQAAERGVTLRLVKGEACRVQGDAHRLRQVVDNLLNNAIHFSSPGQIVELRLDGTRTCARVEVRDEGPGVPEEFRSRLFTRFAQADGSDRRQRGGSGLGLSIAKVLVEAHGGTIGYQPREGGGSVFWFQLPLTAPAPPVAPSGPEALAPRILVCEDDEECAHLLATTLTRHGFQAQVATSARQAMELLRTETFDGLSLDVDLPDMDGLEMLRRVRAEGAREVPAVVLSGSDLCRLKGEEGAPTLGIRCWLSKPVTGKQLSATLRAAVGQQTVHRPKVLHIEPSAELRAVLRTMVGRDAELLGTESADEAIAILDRQEVQAILMDADLEGGGAARVMQHSPQGVPVILFSATEPDPALLRGVVGSLIKTRQDEAQLIRLLQGVLRR